MKNKDTLTITLTVKYDLNATQLNELQDLVEAGITNLIGNGGLSGDTPATVDTWKLTIDQS